MTTESWSLEEIDGRTRRISGGGVSLEIPYSRELVKQLAEHRPGLDLLDELLRSEHTPYIQDRLAVLVEPFPDRGDWRALDFGCGAGGSSTVLARLGIGHIIGVDLVNDYAAIWRRRLDEAGYPGVGTFVQAGESLRLPFRDGSFDATFLNGVLEHRLPEERRKLLVEARRLVRVGGHLFISETPNRWFPRNSHNKTWFSEMLPLTLAARYVARFGLRKDFPTGGRTALYRTGFRGLSVRQIKRLLGSSMSLVPSSERVSELEFILPRTPFDASGGRTQAGEKLWRGVRWLARIGGVPPVYLAPHLNLVFRKSGHA
jgi:ubiquinone/menaquinone biosynthesis C-methylase UbiE